MRCLPWPLEGVLGRLLRLHAPGATPWETCSVLRQFVRQRLPAIRFAGQCVWARARRQDLRNNGTDPREDGMLLVPMPTALATRYRGGTDIPKPAMGALREENSGTLAVTNRLFSRLPAAT